MAIRTITTPRMRSMEPIRDVTAPLTAAGVAGMVALMILSKARSTLQDEVAYEFRMPSKRLDRLLTELEECRYRFGQGETSRVVKLLNSLAGYHFPDSQALIRFHEALLFLRAFPHDPAVVRKTQQLLN